MSNQGKLFRLNSKGEHLIDASFDGSVKFVKKMFSLWEIPRKEKVTNTVGVLRIHNNLLTVQEAARITGFSEQKIRTLIKEKKIDAKKPGKTWEINRFSLGSYIDQVNRDLQMYVTIKEASRITGLSEAKLRILCKSKIVLAKKEGRVWKIDRRTLNSLD